MSDSLIHRTTYHYQALCQISKIRSQAVPEKSVTEFFPMQYMGVGDEKEKKNGKRRQNNHKHLNSFTHNTICHPLGVYKFEEAGSNMS